MMHGEMVDEQIILVVNNIGRFYIPCAVIQNNVGRLYTELGFWLSCQIFVEADDGIQIATLLLGRVVVIPRQ